MKRSFSLDGTWQLSYYDATKIQYESEAEMRLRSAPVCLPAPGFFVLFPVFVCLLLILNASFLLSIFITLSFLTTAIYTDMSHLPGFR